MKKRNLGIIKVAISLVTVHYGLGFLLGTSEAVYNTGLSGTLYSLSCGLGLIFLTLLVPFYWKNKLPIWDLLGSIYGKGVKNSISILSCLWMIGVVASQVLGAAYILSILGVSPIIGMIFFTIAISLVSQIQIKKLSSVFLFLLILSSVSLLTAIFKLSNFQLIKEVFVQTPQVILKQSLISSLGIALPTILITVLGMDFHQFVVQGKTRKSSILGTLAAGAALLLVSFLPTIVVRTAVAKQIIGSGIDGKQVIPYVLLYVGKSFGSNILGYFLVIALLAVAIGSGSGVTRIVSNTIIEFTFLPKIFRKKSIQLLIISLVVIFLALIGKTIISLIVSFYVIYICGVLVPFLIYLVRKKIKINVSSGSVQLSILSGSISSFMVFVISKLDLAPINLSENIEFNMILIGLYVSLTAIVMTSFFTQFILLIPKYYKSKFQLSLRGSIKKQ